MLPFEARAAQEFSAAGGRGSLRALPAFGALREPAHKFAERLDATLVNMRFVNPLDEGPPAWQAELRPS